MRAVKIHKEEDEEKPGLACLLCPGRTIVNCSKAAYLEQKSILGSWISITTRELDNKFLYELMIL